MTMARSAGINARHLGRLRCLCQSPDARAALLTETLARTLKNEARAAMRKASRQQRRVSDQEECDVCFGWRDNGYGIICASSESFLRYKL